MHRYSPLNRFGCTHWWQDHSGILTLTLTLTLTLMVAGPLWNPELQPISMGPLALGGAAAGIGVKEWLYRITLKAGKKHRSQVCRHT